MKKVPCRAKTQLKLYVTILFAANWNVQMRDKNFAKRISFKAQKITDKLN